MTRVPASLALLALRHSGHNLKPATLRSWKHRGHLSGGRGYDLAEVLAYLDRRHAEPQAVAA